jgi:glycosyltransferase involved in cell wall biosynthesis
MPVYLERREGLSFLARAIDGMHAQSDPRWKAIIVNDCSPCRDVVCAIDALKKQHGDRFEVLHVPENIGQGMCRNLAIGRACEIGAPVVLFNDADDVSHPDRVRTVREVLLAEPEIDVVYSTMEVIDEYDCAVPYDRLPPPIQEIIDSHANPVEGPCAWIRIATETGYTTTTSSTAVRSHVAAASPFPTTRVSEDSYTWLCMSARGARFKFVASIPSNYRIPTFVKSQSMRDRLGGTYQFNRGKVVTDAAGFFDAVNLALARNDITLDAVGDLTERFLLRLARTMRRDGASDIATHLESKVQSLTPSRIAALAADTRLLMQAL